MQSLEGGSETWWRQRSNSSKLVADSTTGLSTAARSQQSRTDSTSASAVSAVGSATDCAAAVEQEIGAEPDRLH